MIQSLVGRVLEQLVTDLVSAVPRLIAGLVVLVVAGVGVKVVTYLLGRTLRRTIPEEAAVYRQFVVTIVTILLWFAVALTTLSVLGLTAIAASLGTATGFVALGVAYALSGMLADAVSGIYLLRDPDFNPGDTVTVDGVTGEVKTINLRKTRLAVDGDTVVRANAAIESKWRRHEGPTTDQVASES